MFSRVFSIHHYNVLIWTLTANKKHKTIPITIFTPKVFFKFRQIITFIGSHRMQACAFYTILSSSLKFKRIIRKGYSQFKIVIKTRNHTHFILIFANIYFHATINLFINRAHKMLLL